VRTHLLRTFHASPASEPDTGPAANDENYGLPEIHQACAERAPRAVPLAPSGEDEYALGGYAGI